MMLSEFSGMYSCWHPARRICGLSQARSETNWRKQLWKPCFMGIGGLAGYFLCIYVAFLGVISIDVWMFYLSCSLLSIKSAENWQVVILNQHCITFSHHPGLKLQYVDTEVMTYFFLDIWDFTQPWGSLHYTLKCIHSVKNWFPTKMWPHFQNHYYSTKSQGSMEGALKLHLDLHVGK